MKRIIKTLVVLAFLVCCGMTVLDIATAPAEAPEGGAALVASMLGERAEKTAEALVIEQTREETKLPERYNYREEGRSVPVRD